MRICSTSSRARRAARSTSAMSRRPGLLWRKLGLRHLRVADDGREDVVEVVRDAAGQRTDRFHLLRVEQLGLERASGHLRAASLGRCRARTRTRFPGRRSRGTRWTARADDDCRRPQCARSRCCAGPAACRHCEQRRPLWHCVRRIERRRSRSAAARRERSSSVHAGLVREDDAVRRVEHQDAYRCMRHTKSCSRSEFSACLRAEMSRDERSTCVQRPASSNTGTSVTSETDRSDSNRCSRTSAALRSRCARRNNSMFFPIRVGGQAEHVGDEARSWRPVSSRSLGLRPMAAQEIAQRAVRGHEPVAIVALDGEQQQRVGVAVEHEREAVRSLSRRGASTRVAPFCGRRGDDERRCGRGRQVRLQQRADVRRSTRNPDVRDAATPAANATMATAVMVVRSPSRSAPQTMNGKLTKISGRSCGQWDGAERDGGETRGRDRTRASHDSRCGVRSDARPHQHDGREHDRAHRVAEEPVEPLVAEGRRCRSLRRARTRRRRSSAPIAGAITPPATTSATASRARRTRCGSRRRAEQQRGGDRFDRRRSAMAAVSARPFPRGATAMSVPSATPGHSRTPPMHNAAMAMPAAGQSGGVSCNVAPSRSPTAAVIAYAAARASERAPSRPDNPYHLVWYARRCVREIAAASGLRPSGALTVQGRAAASAEPAAKTLPHPKGAVGRSCRWRSHSVANGKRSVSVETALRVREHVLRLRNKRR